MKLEGDLKIDYSQIINGNPERLIFLLHGYGSNKEDMEKVAHMLQLENTAFIIPNAPHPCNSPEIEIPSANGFYWFPLHDFNFIDISNSIREAGVFTSKFITNEVKKLEIPFSKVVVAGFSQGGILSCQVGTILSNRIAGVICLSGMFTFASTANQTVNTDINYTIIHGKNDHLLSPHFAHKTADELRQISKNVELHLIDEMGHTINQDAVGIARNSILRYTSQKCDL